MPWAGRSAAAERRDSPERTARRRAVPPLPWASSEPNHAQHRLNPPPPAPAGRGARAAAGQGARRAGAAEAGAGRPRRRRALAAWPNRDHRVPTAGRDQSTAGGGALRPDSQWQAAETGNGGPSRRSRLKRGVLVGVWAALLCFTTRIRTARQFPFPRRLQLNMASGSGVSAAGRAALPPSKRPRTGPQWDRLLWKRGRLRTPAQLGRARGLRAGRVSEPFGGAAAGPFASAAPRAAAGRSGTPRG